MAMAGMMGMGMYGCDPTKADALERSVKELQEKMKVWGHRSPIISDIESDCRAFPFALVAHVVNLLDFAFLIFCVP